MCGYPYQIITSFSFWCTLPRGRDGLQSELVQRIVLVLAVCYCSVAQSCPTLLRPHRLQHARPLCPSLSPEVCSDSCPPSWWCSLPILSSAASFSFCLQYFPISWSFPMSQLFTSGGQSFRGPTLASVLPMNGQGWFPTLTGLILQSRWISTVFSSTTIQKH